MCNDRASYDLLKLYVIIIASLKNIATSSLYHFKCVTSSIRQRRTVLISAQLSLLIIVCCLSTPASCNRLGAMNSREQLLTALRLRANQDTFVAQDGGAEPQTQIDSRCAACTFSKTLSRLADAIELHRDAANKRTSSKRTMSWLRRCGFVSYAQYSHLCLSTRKANTHHKPQPQLTSTDSSSRSDVMTRSALQKTDLTLSRRKRLAIGDRRLRRLFSRTGYLLEIVNGKGDKGKVRGSLSRTPTTIFEIRAVGPNGLVRFYNPTTKFCLAMNNKGKLYATRLCSSDECDFIERMNESLYSTYHSSAHEKQRPESALWYISIGRKGRPRKATRVNASRDAVQFLPRPL